MDYPIYIDGTESGTLTVTQEGIRTRFTARCREREGIIRLRVFGEGRSVYLGVLYPKGDGLMLSKTFTKNEMSHLPRKIEYAANAEIRNENQEKDTNWIMSTNGCLVRFEGEAKFVAIPADSKRLEKTGLVRNIDGREYLVFRR